MSTVTLTNDYKVTLPKEVVGAMHIQPGQQYEVILMGSIIQLVPKTTIKELRGIACGANPAAYRARKTRT